MSDKTTLTRREFDMLLNSEVARQRGVYHAAGAFWTDDMLRDMMRKSILARYEIERVEIFKITLSYDGRVSKRWIYEGRASFDKWMIRHGDGYVGRDPSAKVTGYRFDDGAWVEEYGITGPRTRADTSH